MNIVAKWLAGFRGYEMVGPFEKLEEAQSSTQLNNNTLRRLAMRDGGAVIEVPPNSENGDERMLFASSRFIYGEQSGFLWRLPRK